MKRVVPLSFLKKFLTRWEGRWFNSYVDAWNDVRWHELAGCGGWCDGAVWRPGIYELKEETSLEQVVELAGGFQPDYLTDCIVLERLSPIGRELIPVLYEKNYLGTAVRNFDVIKIYPNSSILPKYFCLDTPQNKALSLNQ